MAYRSDLDWMSRLDEFSDDETSVLMTLSHERYQWRTRDRVAAVTGLDPKRVDGSLAGLISRGLVRPSVSKRKKIIFGLVEIVGTSRRTRGIAQQSATPAGDFQTYMNIVRDAQQALRTLGYYDDAVDGLYGLKTKTAFEAFQRDHGLPQTGQPDTTTLEVLRKAGTA